MVTSLSKLKKPYFVTLGPFLSLPHFGKKGKKKVYACFLNFLLLLSNLF